MTLKSRLHDLAERMPEKPTPITLLSLKLAILLMLDEVDATLDRARPGRGIDEMLGTNVVPLNPRQEAAE